MSNKSLEVTVDRKEDAKKDYLERIRNSWTYRRLTDAEIKRLEKLIDNVTRDTNYLRVKGDYKSQWIQFHNIYGAFLAGLGYDGGSWRDN